MNKYSCSLCVNSNNCMIRSHHEKIFSDLIATNKSLHNFVDANLEFLHWNCVKNCCSKNVVFECISISNILGNNVNLQLNHKVEHVFLPGTFIQEEDAFYFTLNNEKYSVYVKSENKAMKQKCLIAEKVFCLECFLSEYPKDKILKF